jgi:DNA-binding NarL/FixJ family response regulator
MTSEELRIGIIEDHPIVSEALEKRLGDAGLRVTASVAAVEGLDAEALPDMVVCDLNLLEGGLQAGQAVAFLVDHGVRVLAMSGVARKAEVLDAVASGAAGFVEKTAPPAEFVAAVLGVADGGMYVSARLATYLLDDAEKRPLSRDEIGSRERALLQALATGDTAEEFMEEHQLTETEIRRRLNSIFATARKRRRLHRPSPREAELLVLLGCEGLSHKAAAVRMGVKPRVIPDFQKEIKAKYLATHPDVDDSIAPKTVAQLWARELGLC